MKYLFYLALRSLINRKTASLLTVLSIGLSVWLTLSVEHIRRGAKESFENSISGIDLIVGARTGSFQLLMFTVFQMGSPNANLSFTTLERYQKHPLVDWVVPVSMGDSHKGYRVLATSDTFFDKYRLAKSVKLKFSEGQSWQNFTGVVLGSEVAQKMNYRVGDTIVLSHGMAARSLQHHDDKPFYISGILSKTHTSLDRLVIISLQGMQAIHHDWQDGAAPLPGEETPLENLQEHDLHPHEISAFYIGLKSRISALTMLREINTDKKEPLTAIIPGLTLAELWNGLNYAEDALFIITLAVIVTSFLAMLIAIYSSLQERRREMAVLRSLGGSPGYILLLFLAESFMLSFLGSLSSLFLFAGVLLPLQSLLAGLTGLVLPAWQIGAYELKIVFAVITLGSVLGFFPAYRAYRNQLHDGLEIKN